MKKKICLLMSLFLVLPVWLTFALETGDYTWQNYTIQLAEIQEKPMFAPADMKDDERALGLVLKVPETLATDETLSHALYESACLTDENGQVYRPGAAMSKDGTFTYLFAVPKALDSSSLRLMFEEVSASNTLQIFVGDWEGQSGNIYLTFTVNEDGSGQYTFEQSGYRESYPVHLSADDNSFAVDIPENNALSITDCRGTWQYTNEVLTLNVVTTFKGGRQFKYSIPCRRMKDSSNGLEAQLGKCPETDKVFFLPGNITWDSTADDIAAFLGKENLEQGNLFENSSVLFTPKAIPWDQGETLTGYGFQHDKLIFIAQELRRTGLNREEFFNELCDTLSKMYGETNLSNFGQISSYLTAINISPENLLELENAPWCAWILPDQNTLVFALDYLEVGIIYLNTARLQIQ